MSDHSLSSLLGKSGSFYEQTPSGADAAYTTTDQTKHKKPKPNHPEPVTFAQGHTLAEITDPIQLPHSESSHTLLGLKYPLSSVSSQKSSSPTELTSRSKEEGSQATSLQDITKTSDGKKSDGTSSADDIKKDHSLGSTTSSPSGIESDSSKGEMPSWQKIASDDIRVVKQHFTSGYRRGPNLASGVEGNVRTFDKDDKIFLCKEGFEPHFYPVLTTLDNQSVFKLWRNGEMAASRIELRCYQKNIAFLAEVRNAPSDQDNGFYKVPVADTKDFFQQFLQRDKDGHWTSPAEVAIHAEFMEKAPGYELFSWLHEPNKIYPRFTEQAAKAVTQGLLQFSADAHRHNYVHRDLKPENLILGESMATNGEKQYQLTVVDGSFSRRLARPDKEEHPSPTPAEEKLGIGNNPTFLSEEGYRGTPLYSDPSILQDKKNFSSEFDLHSIALILMEMVFKSQGAGCVLKPTQDRRHTFLKLPSTFKEFYSKISPQQREQLNAWPWLATTLQDLWPLTQGEYDPNNAAFLDRLAEGIEAHQGAKKG